MTRAAPAFLFILFCTYRTVQCCNLPTPTIKAYTDGSIKFTIPPHNVHTWGADYQIFDANDEEVAAGSHPFIGVVNQEQEFGVKIISGPTPLGFKVIYEMYKGEFANRTCVMGPKKLIKITELFEPEEGK